MGNILPSYSQLKQWDRDCRNECQPFFDLMAAIISRSPVSYYAQDGKLSAPIYPADVQAQLDELQGYVADIIEKYKKLSDAASSSTQGRK